MKDLIDLFIEIADAAVSASGRPLVKLGWGYIKPFLVNLFAKKATMDLMATQAKAKGMKF